MKRLVGIILGASLMVLLASIYVFNNYQYMEEFQDLNNESGNAGLVETPASEYKEITSNLENEELRVELLLESEDTYTLQGTIYETDTMTSGDNITIWKETNKKAKVVIKKDTLCEESYTGEVFKASEVFENYIPVEDHGYTFEFENGECTRVYLPHNY